MDGHELATASATDKIRKFAALKAAFTAKDLEVHYGTKNMRPIAQRLAHNSELMLHAQVDAPDQKQAIYDLIDTIDGPLTNDWSGEKLTKDKAKAYVRDYQT